MELGTFVGSDNETHEAKRGGVEEGEVSCKKHIIKFANKSGKIFVMNLSRIFLTICLN